MQGFRGSSLCFCRRALLLGVLWQHAWSARAQAHCSGIWAVRGVHACLFSSSWKLHDESTIRGYELWAVCIQWTFSEWLNELGLHIKHALSDPPHTHTSFLHSRGPKSSCMPLEQYLTLPVCTVTLSSNRTSAFNQVLFEDSNENSPLCLQPLWILPSFHCPLHCTASSDLQMPTPNVTCLYSSTESHRSHWPLGSHLFEPLHTYPMQASLKLNLRHVQPLLGYF